MKRFLLSAGFVSCGFCSVGFADDDAAKRFQRFDTNRDNVLSSADIQASEARFFDRILRLGDQDGDGQVTLEEFTVLTSKMDPVTPKSVEPTDPKPRREAVRPEGEAAETRMRLFDEAFNRFDRDGDGKISRDEAPRGAPRLQELFDRLETESISKEQFRNVMESVAQEGFRRMNRPEGGPPMGPPRERMRPNPDGEPGDRPRPERPQPLIFRLLDKDGNGRLSKEELANAQKVLMEFDRNQDGELDPSELPGPPPFGMERPPMDGGFGPGPGRPPEDRPRPGRPEEGQEVMRRGGPDRPGQGAPLFARHDANKDGVLTEDEVAGTPAQERFHKMDADQDGKVTAEEFRQFFIQQRRDAGEAPPVRKKEASKD